MPGRVRIGTSGWNYPAGQGTWNGIFYPAPRGRAKGFDELAYYAEHFNTVEVNATFYGQPRAAVTAAWVRRTPPGFEFSVVYQKFTHPRMFKERLARGLHRALGTSDSSNVAHVGDVPSVAEAIDVLAKPSQADLDEFKHGIEPLANAARLGALLAQFPPSFKYGAAECGYLTELLRTLRGYPVAVELRHSSWSDRFADTLRLLNAFEAAWAQIDEPKFRFSIAQNALPNVQGFYYMRLHGRNAEKWWRHDQAEERYDYLYGDGELREFSETAKAASQIVKKVYLYTNNHFSAKSVANAAMIKRQLGEPIEGEYPEAFVARYPDLVDAVRVMPAGAPDGLFIPSRKP